MFQLKIETDNEAFEEDAAPEVARILRDLAAAVEGRGMRSAEEGRVRDINGNTVGQWSYERSYEP